MIESFLRSAGIFDKRRRVLFNTCVRTDEEIGAVQAIAMGVSAGKIRAQFRQVREGLGYA